MTSMLYIKLNEAWLNSEAEAGEVETAEPMKIDWYVDSGNTESDSVHWQYSTLAEINIPEEDFISRVVIPGERVLLTQVKLPKQSSRYLLKAIPFLVEEQLALDIDEMHFALGPKLGGEEYSVACVAKTDVELILDRLAAATIYPESLIADYQLLPTDANSLCVLVNSQQALVNHRQTMAGSFDVDNVNPAVDALLADAQLNGNVSENTPLTMTLLAEPEWLESSRIWQQQLALEDNLELDIKPLDDSNQWFLQRLVAKADQAINLLQGDYTAKAHQSHVFRWRPLVLTSAVCTLVYCGLLFGAGLYYQLQAESLSQQTVALYREYFPNDKRVVNIKTQMNAHLNQSTTNSSGFLNKIGQVGNAWQPQQNLLQLNQLRFDQSRGALTLEVDAKTIGNLDGFMQALLSEGIQGNLQSVNESKTGVRGRYNLGGQ